MSNGKRAAKTKAAVKTSKPAKAAPKNGPNVTNVAKVKGIASFKPVARVKKAEAAPLISVSPEEPGALPVESFVPGPIPVPDIRQEGRYVYGIIQSRDSVS